MMPRCCDGRICAPFSSKLRRLGRLGRPREGLPAPRTATIRNRNWSVAAIGAEAAATYTNQY